MKANILLSVIIILILGALIVLLVQLPERIAKPIQATQAWSDKEELDYANILPGEGLQFEAVSILENMLKMQI